VGLSATTLVMSWGVNYTATTDSSVDWSAVTNNSYFYDKTNKIVYYKNTSGVVIGAYDTFTGGTVNGLSATTFSASTYLGLPLDVYVTGGTYSNGTIVFTNNSGSTFDVTGLTDNDIYVTGFTYQDNTFTISDSSGSTFNATIDTVTGLTVNGILSASTISGGTFYGDGSNLTGLSSGLNVGTTQITNGTSGRVLFQSGTTIQQDGSFNWDNTNKRLGIGANATSPSAALNIRTNVITANDILTLQNGQYGNTIFRIRDNATASESTVGSFFITGLIHGGNSGVTRRFDLGGFGLGSYGDFAANAVWENNQGNIGDGQGTSVIAVSSNFYVNLQTTKKYKFEAVTGNFGIGNVGTLGARLDVRAQGVLSTDISFRVRNNGDTANIISVQGNNVTVFGSGSADADDILIRAIQSTSNYFKLSSQGGVAIGSGSTIPVAGSNNTAIAIGLGSQSRAYFTNGGGVAIGQSTYADANSVSIGTLAKAGLTAGGTNTSISIGYNTQTNASGGDRGIAIGSNAYGGLSNSDVISIGTSVTQGNFSSARNTFIGQYITGAISQTDMVVLGGGTGTGASAAQPTLINSFSVYLGNTQRSFFVNKNSNVVLHSLQSLTSGTNFDASATNTITIHSGTTPTTNITDAFQQYSADITAGNAAPHFRTENGSIVKIYQETTGVTSSTLVSNGGTTITDTDTFDGYTLQKVVKALRNLGILQ